jgi:ketopantoate reductase
MKIATIGSGAMGCLFGVRLLKAGHEIRTVLPHNAAMT